MWGEAVGPAMFLDFLMLKFLNEPCPICKGTGMLTMNAAVCPMTCDHCDGAGQKSNPLVMLVWLIVMGVLTFGPFLLLWVI